MIGGQWAATCDGDNNNRSHSSPALIKSDQWRRVIKTWRRPFIILISSLTDPVQARPPSRFISHMWTHTVRQKYVLAVGM